MTSIRLLSMSIRFLLLDHYIVSLVRWVECGDTRRVGCTGVLGRKESETYKYVIGRINFQQEQSVELLPESLAILAMQVP